MHIYLPALNGGYPSGISEQMPNYPTITAAGAAASAAAKCGGAKPRRIFTASFTFSGD